jgi:hypothetical protein
MSRYIMDIDLSLSAAKMLHNDDHERNREEVKKMILLATLAGVAALTHFGLPPRESLVIQ